MSAGAAVSRLRELLAWERFSSAARWDRGPVFWLVTALLGLLLPAPAAVVVVAARLRRARGQRTGGSSGG